MPPWPRGKKKFVVGVHVYAQYIVLMNINKVALLFV